MKRKSSMILAYMLCMCIFLSGCKKEDPQIVEAQAVIEATEEIRKDPTATTVTVVDVTQNGQKAEDNLNNEAGTEEKGTEETNENNH